MADESLRLSQQQKLQQSLSPLQVQYGRMLEMSGPEAEDEVRRVLDDNPAIEIADSSAADEEQFTESADELMRADYRSDDDIPYYRLQQRNVSVGDDIFDAPAVVEDASISLLQSLQEQIEMLDLNPRQRLLALYVAGNLDDNGYLTRSMHDLADDLAFSTGVDAEDREMAEAIETVRSLDPAGVGARDLRDCLLLQMRRDPERVDPVTVDIVENHYDLFSRLRLEELAHAVGVSDERLRQALDSIRALNPKPGASVGSDASRAITPDFIVEMDGDRATLTIPNSIPELQIADSFKVASAEMPQQHRQWIEQKRGEAQSFIQVLSMRQATLARVMKAIIKLQERFFATEDPVDLKPMILSDIAAITGDDLSVISRATSGKYVATPRGLYPLRFFFNERAKSVDGADSDEDLTTRRVMQALREIIDGEDKKKPLTDDRLAELLAKKGYTVARRTVAKYREALNIPVARLRRLG